MQKSLYIHAVACALAMGLTSVMAHTHSNTGASTAMPALHGSKPLVVGHRGAPGYLPDHTLEGYQKAIDMGADFIEPDLVATKDGHLIARHEPNITATTDVAARPEFAHLKTRKMVDGVEEEGWFATDMTLAQIKTLYAKQPIADRDQSHNGKYRVPTYEEVIALAKRNSARLKRTIGTYPETKHPTYHQQAGLPLEDRLLAILKKHGYTRKNSPVIIQSFEVANLKYLRGKTQVRLVQLVDGDDENPDGSISLVKPFDRPYDFAVAGDKRTFADLLTTEGLKEIKTYADGVSPWKVYLLPSKAITIDAQGKAADANGDGKVDYRDRVLLPPTDVIANAHKLGLFVHTWTMRNEPKRLASDYAGDPKAEYKKLFGLGVDGVFSDFTDTAVAAREGR